MALVGPAMASLYHRCYEYTRQVPKLVREPFMTFFRREFRQGAACGLVLGILWILLAFYSLVGQSQTETQPAVYYTIVFLCLFLVSYYTITVMAQVSQFDLHTKAILKNGRNPPGCLRLARRRSRPPPDGLRPHCRCLALHRPALIFPGCTRYNFCRSHSSFVAQAQSDSPYLPGMNFCTILLPTFFAIYLCANCKLF